MRVETLGYTGIFAGAAPSGRPLAQAAPSTAVADLAAITLWAVTGLGLSLMFALSLDSEDSTASFVFALSN